MQYRLSRSLHAGATMDIKKTSYKKLSKLLSTFEKKVVSSYNVVLVRQTYHVAQG